MGTVEENRQKLMKKARRIREITERKQWAAFQMFDLLNAIVDAYNYGESQPFWDDIVILLSEISGDRISPDKQTKENG